MSGCLQLPGFKEHDALGRNQLGNKQGEMSVSVSEWVDDLRKVLNVSESEVNSSIIEMGVRGMVSVAVVRVNGKGPIPPLPWFLGYLHTAVPLCRLPFGSVFPLSLHHLLSNLKESVFVSHAFQM